MDDAVTIGALKQKIKEFCKDRDWDRFHTPKDLAIGLATEASELLELFRFVNDEEQNRLLQDRPSRQAMADELIDSLYFILRFAERYDFDLATEFERKMAANARKYPVGSR